ncbi:MAG TPA: hypothetical protein VK907_12205 [Phnomibacter sp.]|nr:hypothetical protein [Phnomibacter sp.]
MNTYLFHYYGPLTGNCKQDSIGAGKQKGISLSDPSALYNIEQYYNERYYQ